MDCPICLENSQLLYNIADCSHKFCLNCCMNHITQKSSIFTDIICPYVGCNKPFNKNPQIYNRLLPKVIQNIQKRQRFNFLASNPHIKHCSYTTCNGEVNLKQNKKVCSKCKTPHCPKCIKPFHNGPCILNQQQSLMKNLNYQKCPKCSIWVQKKQGCNYVDCKCGMNFCYSCGVPFNDDPCRLKQKWGIQLQLRNRLQKLTSKKGKLQLQPCYKDKICDILKLPLKLVFLVIYTIIFSLVSNLLILFAIGLIIALSPLLVIIGICSWDNKIGKILLLFLTPILAVLVILLTLLIFSLYPFLRKTNHHGIYDGFDMCVSYATNIYLKGLQCVI